MDAARFAAAVGKAPHDLADHPLFSDEQLARLLDAIPRSNLQVFSMGTDAARTSEWRRGTPGDLAGAELLDAARRGRLWFNVLRVHEVDRPMAALLEELFADLQAAVPGLTVLEKRATLLISSPGAQVYYHADAQPNLLWHVRGAKRVWVYPALDERFAHRDALGRLFTGEADEQLPYEPAWDADAQVVELAAGEVAWWPQNAPHRVVNTAGLNVSLSTEFTTASTNRRVNVRAAEHVARSRLRLPARAGSVDSPLSSVKSLAYRAGRKAGLLKNANAERPLTFQVSREDARGYVDLAAPQAAGAPGA
jgi:hypothetical protein